MRNKLIPLISVILLSLFISSSYVSASGTRIDNITHPETVEIGETFTINILFDYPSTSDCLWSGSLDMYYGIGDPPIIAYHNPMTLTIEDYSTDNPRPSEASIEIDTSTLNCEVGDTFLFKIRYHTGVIIGDTIYRSGDIISEYYDLTIVEVNETNISTVFFLIPLLFLSTIVLIRKRNQKRN